MKRKLLLPALVFSLSFFQLKAQHVKVRMNFPSGVSVCAPGPAPYHGAIWIGPEWRWQGGQYVHVPGYWAKPHGRRHRWTPGRWKRGKRGYCWVPGCWR